MEPKEEIQLLREVLGELIDAAIAGDKVDEAVEEAIKLWLTTEPE